MAFVGIIANDRDFKNIRNISFETLIFCRQLECDNLDLSYLDRICKHLSYLVINSDFNLHIPFSINENCSVITFGLNQKATITISSISENGFVLSLQKNIIKNNKEIYEMEEKCIKTKSTTNYKLYKCLIEYIIEIIYKTP